ncbi:hypothetical protein ACJU26_04820 [Acidithiobacillus sp. M4-SHS-6]|uniref:hypothetical protein n=1 Tax=Acidithiobacillus sp. M4-SHS-6 TaxID=3383024 RepID=UPI0039BDF79F
MNDADWWPIPEHERRAFVEAFETAHAEGRISDRVFARARIEAAIARWHLQAWEAAGRPEPVPDNITEGRPPIESVGIPAVDKALTHIVTPAHVFLNSMAYLLRESDDALETAERRAESCDKAAELLKEAARLLRGADNIPLAGTIDALAPWAERGKFGTVFPVGMTGRYLQASQNFDALTAMLKGKRGTATRAAAVVRALVPFFPNTSEFWVGGGYSLIAGLAKLCGAHTATAAYVRTTLEQARRTVAPAPKPRRDNSLIGLLSKPKI